MKNKKGFTLVELIGVIVILAIIALIITPVITGTINESKNKAYDKQVKNIEDAAKLYGVDNDDLLPNIGSKSSSIVYLQTLIDSGKLKDSVITNPKTGEEMSGCVAITYDSEYNQYIYKYVDTNEKCAANKTYDNGEIVYFDVSTGKRCTNYVEANSATGYTGTAGLNSCLKFYSFNNTTPADRANLILDHNTTATISWALSADGPVSLMESLRTATSNWVGTETPTNYTNPALNYTIDYTGTKARFITAKEIAQIIGKTTWEETKSSSNFYLESGTTVISSTCTSSDKSGCKYGWLYDRTSQSCKTSGCLNNSDVSTGGYWTAFTKSSSSSGMIIYNNGELMEGPPPSIVVIGIRPVIEVNKANL